MRVHTKRRRSSNPRLSKEGAIHASFFNSVAGRPYPPVKSLTDKITVAMTEYTSAFFTTSTTVPTFAALSFTLSALSGSSNYLTIFDQYRIDQVEVWLEPNIPASVSPAYGLLATCVDLDDATTPTVVNQVENHQGALVAQGSQGRYHKWKPHIAVASYQGTFVGFTNLGDQWIDSGSPNVQHYGFKVAAGTTGAAVVSYNLSIRCVVSFRAPGI